MVDGSRTVMSVTNEKVVKRAVARASRTWSGFRAWRQLEPDDRFTLVQSALKSPMEFTDELPLAL